MLYKDESVVSDKHDHSRKCERLAHLHFLEPYISSVMFKLGGGAYAFDITVHHIMIDYFDFSDWFIRTADRRAELRDERFNYWSVVQGW